MRYKDSAIAEIVSGEFDKMSKKEIESIVFTDTTEHYDYDKITCEGSVWIVYWYDVVRDYYSKNKDRIDKMARLLLH